jgi:DGQHR domain-containing protein
MTKKITYPALFARQGEGKTVFAFCATAREVLSFAEIERIGRDEQGLLTGFQRPQIANHIKEIRDYLNQSDAVLPNSVVVAFMDGVSFERSATNNSGSVTIDPKNRPGLVVDGQQRLSALSITDNTDFDVFVTGLLCEDEDELRKQFILINNTKPLPKALIYELIPTVDGLPLRLSSRAMAASLVEQLNYDENSSLKGQIKQHTNPTGVIQDTVLQKLIMASLSDGALRDHSQSHEKTMAFNLLSEFFAAVQETFTHAWVGHKPRTSRLVHGVGLVAMGYVMEHLYVTENARLRDDFKPGLEMLLDCTAWTGGTWELDTDNRRPWNSLQNIPRDYMELSHYLIREIRLAQRQRKIKGAI